MLLFGVVRERNWENLNTGIVVVVDRVIPKDVLTLVPFNAGGVTGGGDNNPKKMPCFK